MNAASDIEQDLEAAPHKQQQPIKHQLYGHLPPITKTIQVRRTRHAVHCWRSKDELMSDVLLWTPSHGRAKAGRPDITYIQQLSADTGCSFENLLEAKGDWEGCRERVRDISADGATSWWWWWFLFTPSLKFKILKNFRFLFVFLFVLFCFCFFFWFCFFLFFFFF